MALESLTLDPIPQVWQDDPHPVYRELRRHHPVHYVESRDLWVLTRYADIQSVIRSPAFFSSAQGVVPSGYAPEEPTIITADPPDHTAMRKAVSRAFTPKRMSELEARIREIAGELVASLPESGVVDAFHDFSDVLPYLVMAELLGLEPETRDVLKRCGDVIVYSTDFTPEEMQDATRELTEHLAVTFAERAREPRNDLISVLLTASPDGDALTHDELLSLCFLLTVAGTETTTSGLGNALLALDHFNDDRARVVADRSLLPTAVDEILRYDSPVQGLSRVTTEPVEIAGTTIPAGARIHMLFAAANRDPEAFDDPDRFDITRSPNVHLAFGFGIHHCLGASLARTEIRIGLDAFLDRFPGYRVQRDDVVRLHSDTNRGFARLPVQLTP
jgi:cytochrome P450